MSSVEERVKKIVAEQLGVNEDEVKDESSFVEDLGADSLDTVELVMALEEEFETEILTKKLKKLQLFSWLSITSTNTYKQKTNSCNKATFGNTEVAFLLPVIYFS